MHLRSQWLLAILFCGCAVLPLAAEDCPAYPATGSVANDPYSISSQNGVLTAKLTLAHSVDQNGYTHYCYKYDAAGQVVEAPTLRVNPGDTLNLEIFNRVKDDDQNAKKMTMK